MESQLPNQKKMVQIPGQTGKRLRINTDVIALSNTYDRHPNMVVIDVPEISEEEFSDEQQFLHTGARNSKERNKTSQNEKLDTHEKTCRIDEDHAHPQYEKKITSETQKMQDIPDLVNSSNDHLNDQNIVICNTLGLSKETSDHDVPRISKEKFEKGIKILDRLFMFFTKSFTKNKRLGKRTFKARNPLILPNAKEPFYCKAKNFNDCKKTSQIESPTTHHQKYYIDEDHENLQDGQNVPDNNQNIQVVSELVDSRDDGLIDQDIIKCNTLASNVESQDDDNYGSKILQPYDTSLERNMIPEELDISIRSQKDQALYEEK